VAILGLAQADRQGNLNVSKFGRKLAGAGGFINISQSARKVVFIGTFMAGRMEIAIGDGGLRIVRDGEARKFVHEVEHRTYSGAVALERGQEALFVTERCVFRLVADGLELIEVAAGIDIERDILARMDFAPRIADQVKMMDARLFGEGAMGREDGR
jgi:propionate CoA-transferase